MDHERKRTFVIYDTEGIRLGAIDLEMDPELMTHEERADLLALLERDDSRDSCPEGGRYFAVEHNYALNSKPPSQIYFLDVKRSTKLSVS